GSAPAARSPRVHVQHAQGATPGGPAGANGGRAGSRPGGSKAGAPSGRPKGPRAPSPSALTPPLPLAFSASLSGIPALFIESFRIPPFLLPLFQAAGTAYGVPWQVLAAINEVETDYGRDLSVSSAGAEGWMQFLPSSWAIYGVDANGDGFKDPYNPADAIFAGRRAGDRGAGRADLAHRPHARTRTFHLAARRLRQHLHIRSARPDRALLSRPAAAPRAAVGAGPGEVDGSARTRPDRTGH